MNMNVFYIVTTLFFVWLQCVEEKISTVSETIEAITLTSKWFHDNVWSMYSFTTKGVFWLIPSFQE